MTIKESILNLMKTRKQKNKFEKLLYILWIFGVIGFIFWCFYLSSEYYNYQNENLSIENILKIEDNFSNSEELHWGHMPLTYYLKESCKTRLDGRMKKDIIYAFDFISVRTKSAIRFKEINPIEEADIIFNCDTPQFKDMLLAQALPNISDENIITSGEVFIYVTDGCMGERPTTYIHEIMHLFGLRHPYKPNSEDLMRPIRFGKEFGGNPCDNDLMDKEVNCLRNIYSNGSIEGDCSKVSFYDGCSDGLYITLDGKYCCNHPNQILNEEGYCDYKKI